MNEKKVDNKPVLLCVDDEKNILVSLKRVFRKENYEVLLAENGDEGLELVQNHPVDVIISDMRMPNMDGAEFLSKVKDIKPSIPSILLTGFSDQESTIRAINEGKISAYVSKPWDDNDIKLKVRSLLKIQELEKEKENLLVITYQQNEQLRQWNEELEDKVEQRLRDLKEAEHMLDKAYEELSSSYDAVVKLLAHAISARDHLFSRDFSELPKMAADLATAAKLSDYMIKQVYYSSLLFELGKLALPEKLLMTPLKLLSVEEFEQFMNYPEIGASVLKDIANFADTARIIEHHYEYFDGSGAPDTLTGRAIPIGSRILGIIKDYFLLQSGKYDGIEHSSTDTRNFLSENKGELYDPHLVDLFLDISKNHDKSYQIRDEHMLPTVKLYSGMQLSRDCTNSMGLLLLTKGTVLNEVMIDKLISVEKVYDTPLNVFVWGNN